jgi:hypothetical protein
MVGRLSMTEIDLALSVFHYERLGKVLTGNDISDTILSSTYPSIALKYRLQFNIQGI